MIVDAKERTVCRDVYERYKVTLHAVSAELL
jgi:hypothetical protein